MRYDPTKLNNGLVFVGKYLAASALLALILLPASLIVLQLAIVDASSPAWSKWLIGLLALLGICVAALAGIVARLLLRVKRTLLEDVAREFDPEDLLPGGKSYVLSLILPRLGEVLVQRSSDRRVYSGLLEEETQAEVNKGHP